MTPEAFDTTRLWMVQGHHGPNCCHWLHLCTCKPKTCRVWIAGITTFAAAHHAYFNSSLPSNNLFFFSFSILYCDESCLNNYNSLHQLFGRKLSKPLSWNPWLCIWHLNIFIFRALPYSQPLWQKWLSHLLYFMSAATHPVNLWTFSTLLLV